MRPDNPVGANRCVHPVSVILQSPQSLRASSSYSRGAILFRFIHALRSDTARRVRLFPLVACHIDHNGDIFFIVILERSLVTSLCRDDTVCSCGHGRSALRCGFSRSALLCFLPQYCLLQKEMATLRPPLSFMDLLD
jgi:hypothetical protein